MKLNTFLRNVILTGIFLIPFIPLLVGNGNFLPNLFFLFITGKNFAFRIIVEIIFAAWIILAITDPAYRPRWSGILYSMLAFIGIIAIADMVGVSPYKSFWSNFERMEGLIALLHLLAFFVVASTTLTTKKLWNWFWNVSLWVSLIIVVYGFLQLSGQIQINQGGVRVDATMGNATYLAIYLLIHMFITAFIALSPNMFLLWPARIFNKNTPNDPHKLITGAVIIILQFVILYHTATRGALLGLIGGVFVSAVLIAVLSKDRDWIKKGSILVSTLAVLVVVGFMLVKNSSFVTRSPVLQRFASISLNETTTKSRFMIWNMAWEGFKERPILGWGQENFNYVFNKNYNPQMFGQEQWFDRTHNVILDWLIAGGILGIISYLSLFGFVLWRIWKKAGDEYEFTFIQKSILTGLLVGYFIHNLFVFDNLTSYILFFGVAAYVYASRDLMPRQRLHTHLENIIVGPVVLVGAVVALYFFNIVPLKANTTLIKAITPQYKVEERLNFFREALNYNSFGNQEIREQITSFMAQVANDQESNPDVKSSVTQFAREEADAQIALTPKDARPYVIVGSVLQSVGDPASALSYFTKAHELSPRKQTIFFGVGVSQLMLEDYKAALNTFKEAYELAPAFESARLLYAVSAIYAKNYALADSLLASSTPEAIYSSEDIMQAYFKAGNYQKVIELWKARVAAKPDDAQSRVSLAAAYLLLKQRTNAVAEIRKAIELEPRFKTQGEQYIKDIQAGKLP